MNINDIYTSGSQWLKSEDLGGRSVIVKIESVDAVTLPNEDKQKLEVGFVGSDKALLLNVTNARTIADLFGSDTDDWLGHEIELFVMPVQGPNGMTKGIRVKAPADSAQQNLAPAPAAKPAPKASTNPFD